MSHVAQSAAEASTVAAEILRRVVQGVEHAFLLASLASETVDRVMYGNHGIYRFTFDDGSGLALDYDRLLAIDTFSAESLSAYEVWLGDKAHLEAGFLSRHRTALVEYLCR